jgi:hypothetical protein
VSFGNEERERERAISLQRKPKIHLDPNSGRPRERVFAPTDHTKKIYQICQCNRLSKLPLLNFRFMAFGTR